MVAAHEGIGGLVAVAFVALLVVNILRATGKSIGLAKPLSFAASGLLLLQYVLGFSLLSSGHSMKPIHYLIALAAIIPVGAEHMMGNSQENPRAAGRVGFIANLVTVVLVVAAYQIGKNYAG